jgi:hypothetical protein
MWQLLTDGYQFAAIRVAYAASFVIATTKGSRHR